MLALKQFKKASKVHQGLPDYLNWGSLIAPGVVLCKDGSLLVGRYFRGNNLAHSDEIAWKYASEAANRALCKLGGGWSLWIDDFRLPVARYIDPALCHFPSAVPQMIDDERREMLTQDGACFDSDYALTLHYFPPLRQAGRLVNLVYDKDPDSTEEAPASAILTTFNRAVSEFDDQISAALDMRPMVNTRWVDASGRPQIRSELVNYLQFCISGELIDLALPHGGYLDGVIGEKPVFPGDMPKVGDMFVACVAISGYPFPSGSSPGVLTRLDALPFSLRWSTRYIVLDQPEAEKQITRIESKWKQKARGFKGILFENTPPNADAQLMSDDAGDAMTRTQSAVEGTGYFTSVVVLMDASPAVLGQQVRRVRRELRDAGYPSRLETFNAMEAFLGTLPGHCVPNVRRPPVHTTNLADLLPLAAPWQGWEHNPCPFYPPQSPPLIQAVTVGSTPINIGLHTGDVAHTLIFGPIGSGKSTLLSTVSMQALRYAGCLVWAFDKGRALMPAFKAAGKYFDIGSSQLAFCPLSVLDTEADVLWAEEWIAACFELQTGHPPRPHHTSAIHAAVMQLRESFNRSITHFISAVQDQDVRDAMVFYSLHGPLGHMLDAERDGLADAPVVGFEIGELMGMGEKSLIPVLTYLFRRFAKALKGQPAYLLLDEAWTMLGHPVFRAKLREWLKELRKANVAVVMATQSLSDAIRSGLLDVLLESCLTRFYGANPAAGTGTETEPGPRQLYQLMGLTEPQIEMVRQAIPKRQYLYSTPDGSALVDLRLGPKTLRFVGSGSKEDLARVDTLAAEHGDAWPGIWLREAGMTHRGVTEMTDA